MSGQIFISYRREESRWSARSLKNRLCQDFDPKQIFMDIDAIALGEDFVETIEITVAKCDVLIAVIGNNWLASKDGHGNRRLDNPEDFVRMEIGTALKRKIRVIPVLVDGALMPQSTDLPEVLKPLVRRNALLITDTSFEGDCQRLAAAIRQVLEKAATSAPPSAPIPTSTLAPAVTGDVSSDPAFFNERAFEFRLKGEFDKAISDYNEAIRLRPNDAGTYEDRGLVYRLKGEYDKGISDYNEAIRLRPNYAWTYENRGIFYHAFGKYDEAISDYTAAIRLDPNAEGPNAEAHFHRGHAYLHMANYDKAISDYTEVIRLYPDNTPAHFRRGKAYVHMANYDKAISDFSEVIRLDPKYALAYNNRGVAYRKQGKDAQAQADFDKAKQLAFPGSQ